MTIYHCNNCHKRYPNKKFTHRCSKCGGLIDVDGKLLYDQERLAPGLPRMWRYKHTFGLPINAPVITLGEGSTPLIDAQAFGHQVSFKLEYMNPTGSFKDRGTAITVSYLVAKKVESAVEDSSGNAGASFAAYAARAGIAARVFIPEYASGPKRTQIEASGAEVVRVPGPRSAASEAVQKAVESEKLAYASHNYLPFSTPGFATIAYELVEQWGGAPGTVVAPVGHGSLLLGIGRGFIALKQAGVIEAVPKLIGVQARACAPLWAVSTMGREGLGWVTEGETIAEGVRIRMPVRGDALLQLMEGHEGEFVAVDEEDILPGRDELARHGFYVEPTSAIVWPALKEVVARVPEPIMVILTGSGLKAQ
jgi:threonine synthase